MTERRTMRSILPMHPPPLHHALKPLPFTMTPRIHELTLHKPIGVDLFAHRQQTPLIPDPELVQFPLGRHALRRIMPQHWLGDVLLVPVAVANADGVVAVSFSRFMCHHLDAVELENCARRAHAGAGVIHGGHAFFDREGASAEREGVGFASSF